MNAIIFLVKTCLAPFVLPYLFYVALFGLTNAQAAGYTANITTAYPQLGIASTSPQVAWYGGNCGNTVTTANPYNTCDDAVSPVMPIGFTFNFAGTSYSTWSMSTNGVIFFETGAVGTASTGNQTYTPSNLPTTVFGNGKPALMPFWADLWKNASANGVLDANSASQPASASFIQYQTLSVSGAQVLVIQLRKVGYYGASGTLVNMQVQLWSTGEIVYSYGSMAVMTSNPNLRIGLQYPGGCNTLANNQSASLSNQSYLYRWDASAAACPGAPTIDHYEIRHDGAATLCAEPVNVLACSVSTKPCPAASIINTQIMNASVTVTGTGTLGTPNINPASFNLEPSSPQQTINLTWTAGSAGNATLGLQVAVKPANTTTVCANVAGAAAYANCNISVANAACIPPPHHYEIQGPASANNCSNTTFTIKAWADAAQTTAYTAGVATGTLTSSGNPVSIPSLGAFTIPAGSSTVNITPITFPAAGATTFNTTATPALAGATTCKFGTSTSCALQVDSCVVITGPVALNAVDVGANAASGKITTKTAGAAFNLDIYALNAGRTTQDTQATGAVLLDFLANTSTGVALDGNGCPGTATSLPIGTVTLTAGKVTASLGGIADAWRDVRVRMRYPATGTATVTACSADNFAVKPASLAVVASDTDWQTAGAARTLNATAYDGTPMHKAGRPFTLRVTGYNASNVITANYNGAPTATSTCVLPATGCVPGAFTTGSFSTSGGTATSNTASYNEAGAISATFTDTGYASVDSADSAASCAGYYVCSSATAIGRFVPDNFAISANTPAFTPACGSFTYLGQPFGFGTAPTWTVTARNAAGGITRNYTGNLFKLAAGTVTGQTWSAASGMVAAVGSLPTVSVIDQGGGQGGVVFSVGNPASGGGLAFARNAQMAPFNASLTLAASVADSDGVVYAGNPYQHSGIGFDGGFAEQRFGRLRLANATGSERLALPVPLSAQYWNGQGFVTNTADNCTALAAPALTFYAQTADNRLASGETTASFNATLAAGLGDLRLSAPGAGNFGFLDLAVSAPDWLKYNWDGVGGYDDSPRARAAFGKRKGSDKVIIRREIY
jgi:MSHA biogenesis protein MshQ